MRVVVAVGDVPSNECQTYKALQQKHIRFRFPAYPFAPKTNQKERKKTIVNPLSR